jgi:uncharacterized protein YerC
MAKQNHEWKIRQFCPTLYEFILQQNFEFSCLEADYLGIQHEGAAFRDLCMANRLEAMANAWGLIATMREGEKFELIPYSRAEMLEIIKKKYKK